MKQKLLSLMLLLCALIVGSGSAWATDVTYTFTSKAWASASGNWSGTSDGNSLDAKGVQCLKDVTYTVTSPSSLSNISSIVVTYGTASKTTTSSKISIKVGSNSAVEKTVAGKSLTDVTLTWSYSPTQSGSIEMKVTAAGASVYIKSVKVTYSSTFSVTYAANGGIGTMTDSNSPYEAGDEVTLLSNTFTAPSGKQWSSWAVTDASSNAVTVTDGKFTMPSSNVTVTAQWADIPASNFITASPTTANVVAAGDIPEFSITTDQTLDTDPTVFYTTSTGDVTTTKPSWITEAEYSDGTLCVSVDENTGAARTAYFRVEKGSVKSDVITINQAAITVATPAFDVTAGTYYADQLVDITCETDGATIYYTTDGSTPTSASTEYDGNGVEISANTTLKAIAIKNGVSSEVATATYTIIHPLTTMDAIFEAATTAGSTATSHYVTFNNWVVTGVKNNQAFVTDGTKGFIIYKSSHGFAVGNILSGTVQASLQLYNGSAEFTTLTYSTTDLTITTGGTVSPYVTTIDALTGVNTGALIKLNGVTYDSANGVLEDGSENTITPYTTLYTGSYKDGTKYNVTGVYQQQSDAPHRIMPRSAADIVEVTDPTITVTSSLSVPNYVVGTADPEYETLTVNGSNLTTDITLSLGESSNFEMSTDLETWTNSLTLTETDGSVTDGEVAIRLKAGLAKGAYVGTMTLSSTGATNATVNLSGSVTGQTYAIEQYTTPATAHGTITFSPASPIAEDATVTLTATPAEGYTFTANSWVVYKESGEDYVVDNSITVTEDQFTMPAYAVYVDGTFASIAVTCVTLNKSTASIGVGDTETLTATIAPTNALNKTVTWSSDDTSVATVSAAGVVTGVAVGSATITATTEDGGFTATCAVTVENVVTFDATSDTGTSPLSKNGVSFACSNGVLNNSSEYRLYKNSETTISTSTGKITKIEFTGVSGNPASGFASQSGWTTKDYDGTWTGSAAIVTFTASGAQVRATKIKVYVATTAAPTFSVEAGEYSSAQSVELSCATDGASIYYTTNGDTPTSSSTAYSSAISITETTTLKAIAIKNEVESAVASATYTMNRPEAPTFDVATCVFDAAFDLHLSAADGATIYYTTDGSTPTTNSSVYSTKVEISAATTTVKAIAVKDGLTSDVASATYTYDSRTTPTFTLSETSLDLKVNDASDAVTLTTNSDATPSFTCADAHVTLTGTGNSRTISANAAGTYTVNVSVTGSATYKDAAGTITVNVTKKTTTMVLNPNFISTDLHVTTSGSLTGTPQYNSTNIAGAEVTYSSSDETVATIAANGAVTFKKAGSTTITVSYEGDDEYEECEETYDLDLTDSTPQSTSVDVTFGNSLYGTAYTGTNAAGNGPFEGTVNNVTVTVAQGSGANLYVTNSETRIYGGNTKGTITITAPVGYVMTNIVFNSGDAPNKWDISASVGTLSSASWTGSASEIIFSASSRSDFTTAKITLAETVTIGSAGYTTYVAKHDISFPEGVTGYIATATNENTVTLTSKASVPEGTAIVVKASAGTYGLPTIDTTPESVTGNLLQASDGSVTGDLSTIYALGKKNGTVGFYLVKSGVTVPAGKAYLEIGGGGSVKEFLTFEFDETGINAARMNNEEINNEQFIFNIAGQRLNKPQRGVNIINGKKVFVK